jgi:hypothetical protein
MKLLSLTVTAGMLAGSSIALPQLVRRTFVPTPTVWTMQDFTRSCDLPVDHAPKSCKYSFKVRSADLRNTLTTCDFTVYASAQKTESALYFSAYACTDGFAANGGYDPAGPEPNDYPFQIITVRKADAKPFPLLAFFGFQDSAVVFGEPASPVSVNVNEERPDAKRRQQTPSVLENVEKWGIMDFHRRE